jgi:hypothetical protein
VRPAKKPPGKKAPDSPKKKAVVSDSIQKKVPAETIEAESPQKPEPLNSLPMSREKTSPVDAEKRQVPSSAPAALGVRNRRKKETFAEMTEDENIMQHGRAKPLVSKMRFMMSQPEIEDYKVSSKRLSLAQRVEKRRSERLTQALNLPKLPITQFRRYRTTVRETRPRPYVETPPLIERRKKSVYVPIERLQSQEFREQLHRESLLPESVRAQKKISTTNFQKAAFEATLPAVRIRREKKGPKHATLSEAVVDHVRVAKLMDVAQFYRGSKRVIGDRTHLVNKNKNVEMRKYANSLVLGLGDFAADWQEAALLGKRAQLLATVWPTDTDTRLSTSCS